ncbi:MULTISPECIES: PcfK-like family protein [Bacteroidales]|uniref:PcfK-like family protein n=1 Tax=Bacteroidales TaxID=171549 RepID=UPI0035A06EB8
MKGTEHFTRTIAEYLNQRAATDPLFAPNLMKPNKNIDECITYILTEVQRMGCAGLSDEEVYSLAVHYYDEDNLKVGKPINCKVVVNHTIELTEEEKAEARENAIKQYQREELAKIRNRNARPKKAETTEIASQPSLFEF